MTLLLLAACAGPPPEPVPPVSPVAPDATTDEPVALPVAIDGPTVGVRDLTCRLDAEIEGATFEWSRDGAVAHLGPVLPAGMQAPGETWTCTVRAGATSGAATHTVAEALGTNVLVLILDDIGIDKIAAYDAHPAPPPMPTVDALAAEGVRFRHVYGAPSCSPARALLLTGRYGARYGLGVQIETDGDPYELPLEEWTLPEVARESRARPWASAAVGKWHLSSWLTDLNQDHMAATGFDSFAGSMGNLGEGGLQAGARSYFHWEKIERDGTVAFTDVYATTDTVDDALARIGELPEPWLLWVGFHAAHLPLHEPPPELHDQVIADPDDRAQTYPAVAQALDTELARMLAAIDPAVLARTTVVLVGDNGTPAHAVSDPLDPATDIKGTLHEGGVRVPLIVTGPQVAGPRVSDELVHLVDLLPTVADIAGVPLTGEGDGFAFVTADGRAVPIDGRSLLPHLLEEAPVGREYLYSEEFDPQGPPPYTFHDRVVRDATHKLIRTADGEELYAVGAGLDEGEELLGPGLDAEGQAAYDRLSAELDRLEAIVTWESP